MLLHCIKGFVILLCPSWEIHRYCSSCNLCTVLYFFLSSQCLHKVESFADSEEEVDDHFFSKG